jgi:O-antigen/teichoic acid export membrane protein
MRTFLELARDSLYSLVFHIAPRLANVALFILISRVSGPNEAGIFALAVSYLLIFTTIMVGLDEMVIRQVAQEPERAAAYLTDSLKLRLSLSVLLFALLLLLVTVIFDYDETTRMGIVILGLSLIPDSLTYASQSVLLGLRHFAAPMLVLVAVSVLKIVSGIVIIFSGGTIVQLAVLWFAASLAGMLIMLFVAVRDVGGLRWAYWRSWGPLARQQKIVAVFLFITVLATLEAQSDIVILSGFHGETEVGLYYAATTITASLILLSQAYRFAAYPLMSRYVVSSPGELGLLYKRSIRIMALISLPMVGGLIILASRVVPLVFGEAFRPTIQVLIILVPIVAIMYLNEPNIRLLLASGRQNRILLFLIVSAVLNIILNLALVPGLGATGSAIARLISGTIFLVLIFYYIKRSLAYSIPLNPLWRPAVATVIMMIGVWLARDWPIVLAVTLGVGLYAVALLLVGAVTTQEVGRVQRYLVDWKKRILPLA